MNHEELARKVIEGDIRAIARLISLVENEEALADDVLARLHEHSGHAKIFGITGPPGSGKSTLTSKLIAELRLLGFKVAVLAVDPSSPFSGGAILGDRIRMQACALDSGVYIRSLATRGHLGGLSRTTSNSVRVLDAAGFDIILIETVGVGQSEIDIVRMADVVLLVSVPGLGDDIQVIKAGIMEIGDIFVVNKSDRDGSDRVVQEIKNMLETAIFNGAKVRGQDFSLPPLPSGQEAAIYRTVGIEQAKDGANGSDKADPVYRTVGIDSPHHSGIDAHHAAFLLPPIIKTSAEKGSGVKELCIELLEYYSKITLNGALKKRRMEALLYELKANVVRSVYKKLESDDARKFLLSLSLSVSEKKVSIQKAQTELFSYFTLGKNEQREST